MAEERSSARETEGSGGNEYRPPSVEKLGDIEAVTQGRNFSGTDGNSGNASGNAPIGGNEGSGQGP